MPREAPVAKPFSRRKLLTRLGYGALATAIPSGLATTYWLSVEHTRLRLPKWKVDGFKAAFLTDLHVGCDADVELVQRAVKAAVEFHPDVILFGGDYVTQNVPENLSRLSESLQPLAAAQCPVLGVLGNHDYWGLRDAVTMHALDDSYIRILKNEDAEVRGVRIIGFDDGWIGSPNYSLFENGGDGRSTIVLLHEPDLVVHAPSWADLQLSGHSHGGQICLPGGIPLMGTYEAENYIRGYYSDARIPLYVSRGLGTTRVNVRLWCRPEVSLLTIDS